MATVTLLVTLTFVCVSPDGRATGVRIAFSVVMTSHVPTTAHAQYQKINIIADARTGGKEMAVYLTWMNVSIAHVRDNPNVLILKGVTGVNVPLDGLV